MSLSVPEAYAVCRTIARREAKNFYWSFRVLPQAKSDAMCALYAFMRKADDLADDESLSLQERREAMAAWTAAWRRTREKGASDDPVFVALADTQARFGISDDLLAELVAGTTMDLDTNPSGVKSFAVTRPDGSRTELQIYTTQQALEEYCYLVASVVGLACIRIFGYSDPRAEQLAIATGKAFQLTNVLRDIREDAERGRCYLPLELLDKHGISPERLLALTGGAAYTSDERAALGELASRAEELYRSADELIPLLDRDSRGAMRVLATIYRRLLMRVRQPDGITFTRRVRVSNAEKLTILLRGLMETAAAKVLP